MLGIVIGGFLVLVVSMLVAVWARACTANTFHRSRIFGYRTPSTLSSDEAWAEAHKAAAPILWMGALGGGLCAITAIALGFASLIPAAPIVLIAGFASLVLANIAAAIPAIRRGREVAYTTRS